MHPSGTERRSLGAKFASVRWLWWILGAYLVVLSVCVVSIGYMGRALGYPTYVVIGGVGGQYRFEVDRDMRAPFHLQGPGRSPGEVRVEDGSGRVIDSVRLEDVDSVHDVTWEKFAVRFSYLRDGRWYRTSLDLQQ